MLLTITKAGEYHAIQAAPKAWRLILIGRNGTVTIARAPRLDAIVNACRAITGR